MISRVGAEQEPQGRWLQVLSAAVLAFLGGIAVAYYQLYPFRVLRPALHGIRALFEGRDHFLHPIQYPGEGVTVHDAARTAPGVTLLDGFRPEHPEGPSLWIVDASGKVLHEWVVSATKIWPKNTYHDLGSPPTWDTLVHGSYLFPNGDVLFNFESIGLQRLDACGKVLWKLPYRTHHSVERDSDGNFWVSGIAAQRSPEEQKRAYPALSPPFAEETAVQVSPDGKLLREIDLLKVLFASGHGELATFGYGKMVEQREREGRDVLLEITHLNDVQPLTVQLAPKFPMFEAGDLLISFRDLNTMFVTSPGGQLKWIDAHAMQMQHDLDFEPDGQIVAFDNQSDWTFWGKGAPKGSRIAAIDPVTHAVSVRYPTPGAPRFYSSMTGKHQLLPNGNRLVTQGFAGRAFEIADDGTIVWEYVNAPFDATRVSEIHEATRYALDAEQVSSWPCAPRK